MCVLDSKIDIVLLSLNNNVSSVRALMLIYVSTPPHTHTTTTHKITLSPMYYGCYLHVLQ
jgi:hypothetical protein